MSNEILSYLLVFVSLFIFFVGFPTSIIWTIVNAIRKANTFIPGIMIPGSVTLSSAVLVFAMMIDETSDLLISDIVAYVGIVIFCVWFPTSVVFTIVNAVKKKNVLVPGLMIPVTLALSIILVFVAVAMEEMFGI